MRARASRLADKLILGAWVTTNVSQRISRPLVHLPVPVTFNLSQLAIASTSLFNLTGGSKIGVFHAHSRNCSGELLRAATAKHEENQRSHCRARIRSGVYSHLSASSKCQHVCHLSADQKETGRHWRRIWSRDALHRFQ